MSENKTGVLMPQIMPIQDRQMSINSQRLDKLRLTHEEVVQAILDSVLDKIQNNPQEAIKQYSQWRGSSLTILFNPDGSVGYTEVTENDVTAMRALKEMYEFFVRNDLELPCDVRTVGEALWFDSGDCLQMMLDERLVSIFCETADDDHDAITATQLPRTTDDKVDWPKVWMQIKTIAG